MRVLAEDLKEEDRYIFDNQFEVVGIPICQTCEKYWESISYEQAMESIKFLLSQHCYRLITSKDLHEFR